MELKIYRAGLYPINMNMIENSINTINEWQNNFTPQSRMQPELIKLYRSSADAFYLYADVDYYYNDFAKYKVYIAPHIIKGLMSEKDIPLAKSKMDKLLFELANLPLDHSINEKSDLGTKTYSASRYGSRDFGKMIDRDEAEFSKKWAWQQEWYRQCQQRYNEQFYFSPDTIESLWLEFAHKYDLISHKSPSPRCIEWIY